MQKLFLVLALLGLIASPASAQEATPAAGTTRTAIFAGGCFWCMEKPFDQVPGVTETVVGYTGGSANDANYSAVSGHKTQHREAIKVTYNPAITSYEKLLDVYWRNIKPTQGDGQFADIGLSYQAAIYFENDTERQAAEASKEQLAKSGKFSEPIVTEILPAKPFYPAEEYHQEYYKKNPTDYERYYVGSGRAGYLKKTWGEEGKP